MRTILYLGTDPLQFERSGQCHGHLIHYPIIQIVPRPFQSPEIQQAYRLLEKYTHLIFTSKNTVKIFCQHLAMLQKSLLDFKAKTLIAIGEVTATHLFIQGLNPQFIAQEETQEGIVKMLRGMDLRNAHVFLPRSALSRSVLSDFFKDHNIRYVACDLYDTLTQHLDPKIDLDLIDEIVFTSPSTVKAFLEIFGKLPSGKKLVAIGPITEEALGLVKK